MVNHEDGKKKVHDEVTAEWFIRKELRSHAIWPLSTAGLPHQIFNISLQQFASLLYYNAIKPDRWFPTIYSYKFFLSCILFFFLYFFLFSSMFFYFPPFDFLSFLRLCIDETYVLSLVKRQARNKNCSFVWRKEKKKK